MVDYKFPNQDDLQLMALSKNPIYVGNVPIYPVTLNQISIMGYSVYSQSLKLLCMDRNDVNSFLETPLSDEKQIYDFLVFNAVQDENLRNRILKILNLICGAELKIDTNSGILEAGGIQINRDNFLSIQKIVKFRNGIEKIEEEIENPANDKAKELLEKRKMLRKKVQEKKSGESNISIGDLVGVLSAGMHLPIDVVMEYDMYQFNDQFNRLKIFKDFEVNVQALLHGADSKDVKLNHWISKTDSKDEE